MIQLIERSSIRLEYPSIASEISKMQRSFYDEESLEWYKEQNDEQSYWDIYDFMQENVIDQERIQKVMGHRFTNINTFTSDLAGNLVSFFDTLEVEEFILISHLNLNFFGASETDYIPLKRAHERLLKHTTTPDFSGALRFSKEHLAEILDIFFWITRCDPTVAEYIFIMDEKSRFYFTICKYGNIHLTELGSEYFPVPVLHQFGFHLIEGYEEDNFSDDGILEGRTMIN